MTDWPFDQPRNCAVCRTERAAVVTSATHELPEIP